MTKRSSYSPRDKFQIISEALNELSPNKFRKQAELKKGIDELDS